MSNAAAKAADVDAARGSDMDYSTSGIEYLTFLTHGRRFAAPITEVREIRNWSTPATLPHAPPFLLGVVNLRGTVLPVIDLALRLGIGPTKAANRNVFVVVEVDDRPIGLLVEAVADIVKPSPDDHQPLPDAAASEANNLVEGLILSDDGMVQILQLSALAVMRSDLPDGTTVEERRC